MQPNSATLDLESIFCEAALEQAQLAATLEPTPEVPIGAVVVLNGEIVGRGHNRVITDHDPSAHAEIVALRDAGQRLSNYRLPECELYVTLEPCAMCLTAVFHARLKRVVFAAPDPKGGACGSAAAMGCPDLRKMGLNHHTAVGQGPADWAQQCSEVLRHFFKEKRTSAAGKQPSNPNV